MKDPYYQKRFRRSKEVSKLRQKTQPLSQQIKQTTRLLMVTIGSLLLLVTVSFLYLRGLQSAKGYTLGQLQTEYEQLWNNHRELQGMVDKAQSLTELQQSEHIENMEGFEEANTNYIGDSTDLASR